MDGRALGEALRSGAGPKLEALCLIENHHVDEGCVAIFEVRSAYYPTTNPWMIDREIMRILLSICSS